MGLLDKISRLAEPFTGGLLQPLPESSLGNVDFDFIKEQEGFTLNGIVPVDKKLNYLLVSLV